LPVNVKQQLCQVQFQRPGNGSITDRWRDIKMLFFLDIKRQERLNNGSSSD